MAAAYFGEIAGAMPEISKLAQDLSGEYGSIAESLSRVSDKEMDSAEKVSLLEMTRDDEAACIAKVAQCVEVIRPR